MPRYIDADAVIEELRQIYDDCDDWETHISQSDLAESEKRILTNRASATKTAMIEVRLRVDKMPSADVDERKKGKWVRDEFGSKCSYCGLYAYRDKFEKPWESNFCPNCGAEMREEEKDE